ncbi:hypothetical protein Q8F55_001290 [Vanrija albida]|uniref:Uncharacterized protein n=1 Tax=Vanrija albida TaxID=181172 RepID=A0ABR3QFM6_9TREE
MSSNTTAAASTGSSPSPNGTTTASGAESTPSTIALSITPLMSSISQCGSLWFNYTAGRGRIYLYVPTFGGSDGSNILDSSEKRLLEHGDQTTYNLQPHGQEAMPMRAHPGTVYLEIADANGGHTRSDPVTVTKGNNSCWPKKPAKKLEGWTILAVIIPLVAALVAFFFILNWYLNRKRRRQRAERQAAMQEANSSDIEIAKLDSRATVAREEREGLTSGAAAPGR